MVKKEKIEKEKKPVEWVWIKEAPKHLKERYGITLSEGLLRQWRFHRKYPIFSHLGGKVFLDVQGLLQILEEEREKEWEEKQRILERLEQL